MKVIMISEEKFNLLFDKMKARLEVDLIKNNEEVFRKVNYELHIFKDSVINSGI